MDCHILKWSALELYAIANVRKRHHQTFFESGLAFIASDFPTRSFDFFSR